MNKKIFTIIQIIIWSFLLCFVVVFFFNRLENRTETRDFRGETYSKVYTIEEGIRHETVQVKLISEDITIYPTDKDIVEIVQYSNKPIVEKEFLQVETKGKILSIKKSFKKKVFSILNFPMREKIEVYIPKHYAPLDLQVQTVSGDIVLEEQFTSDLKVQTTSGDIEGNRISFASGRMETVSGDIELEKTGGDRVNLKTVSGDIEGYEMLLGVVECEAISGDVALDYTNEYKIIPEKMDVSTVSGNIEVGLPENNGFTLDFSTASGKLANDFTEVTKDKKQTVTYKDAISKFCLKTVSGNASVYQTRR